LSTFPKQQNMKSFGFLFALVSWTNAIIKISDDEIYQLTPFGYWHSECVHSVPAASHIENFDGYFTINGRKQSRCRAVHNSSFIAERISAFTGSDGLKTGADGWQVEVEQNMGDVTSFVGNWMVPGLPQRNSGQILYTFPGLQNVGMGRGTPGSEQGQRPLTVDIIQPVLQYGGDGGGYWAISSWYVTASGDAIQSPLVRVDPGDLIYGAMQKVGVDSWFINSVDTENGRNTSITVRRSNLAEQPYAFVVLEVYNVQNCDEYPPSGSIPYTNLAVEVNRVNSSIGWRSGGQNYPICNASISVISDSNVVIEF